MDKYIKLYRDLYMYGHGKMTCYGDSMVPILYSGCDLSYIKQDDYNVGDIVFCVIMDCWIDAHIITKKTEDGFEISDSHGNINGISNEVFGRVVKAEYSNGDVHDF